MLGSWFGQKGEEVTPEGTTPRPSFGSRSEFQPPRLSADKTAKRAFPTAFSTPHDAILSDLQGAPVQATVGEPSPNRPRGTSFKSELVLSPDPAEEGPTREDAYPPVRSEQSLLGPTPSNTLLPAPAISSSTDLLLDPFDGMTLGVLIPRESSKLNDEELSPSPFNLPSSFDAGQTASHSVGTEAVWSHLSRILDLQSQISKKHIEMENIGGTDAKKKGHKHPTKNTSETTNVGSNISLGLGLDDESPIIPPGLNRPGRQRGTSTVSTGSSNGEHEENEEDDNVPNEEAEKTRIREDEFAKLATQFEGRKDAINDIMGKLDELSRALSEFHDLPSPNIEFYNPRQNANFPPDSDKATDRTKEDESRQAWPTSQDGPFVSSRAFDWTTRQSDGSSASRPPSTTANSHKKLEPVIIKPVPEKAKSQKNTIPTLLINSQDQQASFHDSPASIESRTLPQVL